ncbi:serine/threonine-protein kinase pim-3-like [Pimephales promelas]|uniref:serine/threonine-protein kinase pim-3-like n=1 Tax=Pimephales promelas TaxID=90988 RepID=UPI001955D283|nr:serine/threonine-protein kinase pim-3-like [Pimephales promelas]
MEVKLIDFGCGALMKNTAFFDVFSGIELYCPPEVDFYGRYNSVVSRHPPVCNGVRSQKETCMIKANIWKRRGLSHECCQMIRDCLQPWQQQSPILKKMHLHDWFKVME